MCPNLELASNLFFRGRARKRGGEREGGRKRKRERGADKYRETDLLDIPFPIVILLLISASILNSKTFTLVYEFQSDYQVFEFVILPVHLSNNSVLFHFYSSYLHIQNEIFW